MSLINPDKIPIFNKGYNFSSRFEKLKMIWQSKDPLQAVKYISQYITETEARKFIARDFINYTTSFEKHISGKEGIDELNAMLDLDFKTFLVNNNLNKIDRASMSVGLEGREPMLDFQLVEFLATLPGHFKIRNGQTKWILKQIVHRYIPPELMERPKKPFIAPLTVWFRDELSDMLNYYLSEEQLKKTGLFQTLPIVRLKDQYLKGDKVQFQKLWQILSFQLWYSRWMQKL